MHVTIKFSGRDLQVTLNSPDATVTELQQLLEEQTGVLVRLQKILAAGKVITGRPSGTTLASAGVRPGQKLLLIAAASSAGAGSQSQGQAALEAARSSRQQLLEQGRQQLAERAQEKLGRAAVVAPMPHAVAASMRQRAEAWQKTGIAALRDLKLAQLPPELFSLPTAAAVRVLDCGGNALAALPPGIGALSALRKLRLSCNALTDAGMQWRALAALTQLEVLAADDNRLAVLPPGCLSRLTLLEKLSLAGNQLVSPLPDCLGSLVQLRALSLRGNRLQELPPALGRCRQLVELDVRDNRLAALPQELSALGSLQVVLADNNLLRGLPPALLEACTALHTLSLHGCPLTVEALRGTAGWAAFDARRRAKYDKQVDMRVLPAASFDEGADVDQFEHWRT